MTYIQHSFSYLFTYLNYNITLELFTKYNIYRKLKRYQYKMAAIPPRILKETQRLSEDPVVGIYAEPNEKNARHFYVKIAGAT